MRRVFAQCLQNTLKVIEIFGGNETLLCIPSFCFLFLFSYVFCFYFWLSQKMYVLFHSLLMEDFISMRWLYLDYDFMFLLPLSVVGLQSCIL